MTPAARLSAAIEILDLIDQSSAAADGIIRAYFRARRYAGSKDRRSTNERVYAVIRHRARLDWWIAGAAGDMAPISRVRVLAASLLIDRENAGSVANLFDGVGHGPALLQATERDLVDNLAGKPLHHDAMPDGVLAEIPDWLTEPLQHEFGDGLQTEMAALNTPASVDVRVNLGRVSRQQARKSLQRDGIKCEDTPLSLCGLRLAEHARLDDTKAFKKGLIEIQDEGSQLIALLCQARPGMTVIDYCAGAGGKTLALADIMGLQGNTPTAGRLIACDVSAKRLARMDHRLQRSGASAIERMVLDGGIPPRDLNAMADRVLVDAPCSGTGAWRRHPEARWRLTRQRLDEHLADQRTVLEAAAKLVKPGGQLIYATCSLLGEENEDQIEEFLNTHGDFEILPAGQIWNQAMGIAAPPGTTRSQGIFLSPARTGTDGFFCAILGKKV